VGIFRLVPAIRPVRLNQPEGVCSLLPAVNFYGFLCELLIDLKEGLQFFQRAVTKLLFGASSSPSCIVQVCSEVREFGFVREAA